MKPIFIVAIIVVVCSSSGLHSQSVYVPLNHWVYDFIERWETRKVITGVLNGTKPISRKELAGYLAQIITKVEDGLVLNKVEQEQLDFLKFEFQEELNSFPKPDDTARIARFKKLKFIDKLLPDFVYKNNRNFISWQAENFNFYLDPILYRDRQYTRANPTEKVFQSTNGFTFWGNSGNHLGFFFDTRDTREWGTRIYEVGNYTLPGLGFVRATSPHYIYHDETIGYIILGFPHIQLEMGKNLNYWGPGYRGSLILSDYATSYDQFKFTVQYKRFKFSSIYGFLIDFEKQEQDELQRKKYLASHRLEFSPFGGLDIGLSEVIIFAGRSFEPAYLNPIMFYRSAEHYLGSPDNAVMGLDFECTLVKTIKFYGELLIDDITTSKLGTGWYGNKLGILSGLFWVDPFQIPNTDLRLEYARIGPYVYSHRKSINYKHYDSVLGHWTGPNSDNLYGEFNYRFTKSLLATIFLEFNRHGANFSDKNVGGDIDQPHSPGDELYVNFLNGILEKRRSFGLSVSYEIWRNFYLAGGITYVEGRNVIIANDRRGNVRNKEFSFLMGINY
ncbi:MAG: capsule assembly Wzi family protein [candidate division KSB1 bacterium]|nr:capsule assembly Wzi family protein [candidate division KSB1 bacterium]